eukprot:GDKJ01042459.1.p1 GENE.GDKJ01042459.1~~GDKJ01042459.1.p1  ORF type:complete len:216 (+),score=-1.47 GDKJ01042459.1:33-680(+)
MNHLRSMMTAVLKPFRCDEVVLPVHDNTSVTPSTVGNPTDLPGATPPNNEFGTLIRRLDNTKVSAVSRTFVGPKDKYDLFNKQFTDLTLDPVASTERGKPLLDKATITMALITIDYIMPEGLAAFQRHYSFKFGPSREEDKVFDGLTKYACKRDVLLTIENIRRATNPEVGVVESLPRRSFRRFRLLMEVIGGLFSMFSVVMVILKTAKVDTGTI